MKNLGYTREMAIEASSRYKTKMDFIENEFSLYKWASRRGFWPEMTAHMKNQVVQPRWTLEAIKIAAKDCADRTEFRDKYPGAYARAFKKKILDDVCSHMKRRPKSHEVMKGRVCLTCGIYKDREEMVRYPKSKSGIGAHCKKCKSKAGCEYAKQNPAWKNAQTAMRRAKRHMASPPWTTKAQKKAMAKLYRDAKAMTEETGIVYEVDHIVPIAGKNVCGLHLPINMRVITRDENRKKLNKFNQEEGRACFN